MELQKIWNLNNTSAIKTLVGHDGAINSVKVDSKRVFTCSADTTIKIWDLDYGLCTNTLESHSDEVVDCIYNDQILYSCSFDSTVKLWDMKSKDKTLMRTFYGHQFRITDMQLKENKLLTASWDKTARLFELL